MCWCDEYDFTINRADEYMVKEKATQQWYVIAPPDVIKAIEKCLELGYLEKFHFIPADEKRSQSFLTLKWGNK